MPVNFPAPEGGYEKVGKLIGVLGQNAEYYFWEITLSENQIWQSDVIQIKGKSVISIYLHNTSASPGALATSGVAASNADGTKTAYIANLYGTPGAGAFVSNWNISPSQYIRVKVASGSTAGTYTVRIWLAIYPM